TTMSHTDFFFSSRRRHTISKRDWSSDVCSSDLDFIQLLLIFVGQYHFCAILQKYFADLEPESARSTCNDRHFILHHAYLPSYRRSEERRVGKESTTGEVQRLWQIRALCETDEVP